MNKKRIVIFVSLFLFYQTNCFFYINDEKVTFRTILTGNCVTSIDYNIINNKDGGIGGNTRLWGIHNMTIEVPGYEVLSLVENDKCLHPSLFTMLNILLSDHNIFVQRWACVKWFLPLSFGFKVENDSLTIFSSIWKYRFLSLFRAQKTIELVKKDNFNDAQSAQNLMITVTVNGRSVLISQRTVVQIYSKSALYIAAFAETEPLLFFL